MIAVFAVETLIGYHRANARREIQTATAVRAEMTAEWTYLRGLWSWADCAFALDQAAKHRRLLALLYQLRRRDVEFLYLSDWYTLQDHVGLRHDGE